MTVVRPVLKITSVLVSAVYSALFGWYETIGQRKANQALLDDITSHMFFLTERARFVKSSGGRLPFDYANVQLEYRNVLLSFTRGQGQLNVLVSRAHSSERGYDLAIVNAALPGTHNLPPLSPDTLSALSAYLKDYVDEINDYFSSDRFPEFSSRLEQASRDAAILCREAEWRLNKQLKR